MPRRLNGYLTVKGAAEFLGVSAETLRNWDRSAKLTPRRHPVNGYRLYEKNELEAMLLRVEGRSAPEARPGRAGAVGDEGGER
ncbi:MerR family DNA-binding transcriptional regulator [Paludisphaera mucosa]|uniref:MerR family DNA-binding transcriptional regulator n=1 Tax=Paludisphaera mucosa TaxID=3030827 RepID=A0ABT6FKU7_9BACT|nr:MerR family DNA-binding transcriptional regulator [Paludisphaera mucosa]MDG3008202.1 MerR family DNA-binding transcriptional regulator [Paludisphaera mucosa]